MAESVPQIRVEGFTEPWEQRKLGDIATFMRGERFTAEDYVVEGGIPSIHYGEIHTRFGVTATETFSHVKSDLEGSLRYARPGDVIIAATSENVEDVCTAMAWLGKEQVAIHDDCFAITSPLDPRFLSYFFASDAFFWQKTSLAYGVKVMRVNADALAGVAIGVPPAGEQRLVGDTFVELDNLITLHQREGEKYSRIKKTLLDLMFPRDGELEPRLRFEGFTEPWEQRKLGDYLSLSSERNSDLQYGTNDVYSVSWASGVVNQIEFQGRSYAGADLSGYDVVHPDEVIYTKSPLRDEPFGIVKTNHLTSGIVSQLYAVYRALDNCDPSFVETYFGQSARLNNYFRPLVNKGAKNTMNISDEETLNGTVVFPSFDEQRAISALFASLDNLITLHQQELEKLKRVKSTLLRKMFV